MTLIGKFNTKLRINGSKSSGLFLLSITAIIFSYSIIYARQESIHLGSDEIQITRYATEMGKVTLSFKDQVHFVRISIWDTGIGIRSNIIKELFYPEQNVSTLGTEEEKVRD